MTRFGHVLKLDFTEGRKAMMWGAVCMLLLYLFFFWFAWNIVMHSYNEAAAHRVAHAAGHESGKIPVALDLYAGLYAGGRCPDNFPRRLYSHDLATNC